MAATTAHSRILEIPLGNEFIPVDLDDLPADLGDVVELLTEERPPTHIWTRLATQCWSQNRWTEAEDIIRKGCDAFNSQPETCLPLYNMLAAFQVAKARQAPKTILPDARYQNLAHLQPKEAHYREATSAFNFANRVDPGNLTNPNNLINVLGQGIYYTATGANDAAQKNFDVVLGRQPRNVLALLGKACILLRKRSYLAALKLYQDVLRLSLTANEIEADLGRWKGPDPRVGIGLCLWGLGRQEDARRAWKRAAEVSPKSAAPHLLLGLSAINAFKNPGPLPPGYFGADITTDEAGARSAAYKQGIASIQEAWKRDNRNAAAAVALAEHFVDRAQHAQALKLSEHAIQYADSRSALTQAYLYFARAAHLAAQAGGAPELRPLALRFYAKAADDLGRTFGPTPTAAPGLPAAQNAGAGLALAGLGTAQLQLSARDVLAAMNTLDGLLSKQPNCIEGALMAASLRAKSHPGASKEELAADRERARSLLDRALKSVDAASAELAASATAVASVSGLSRLTLAAIVALGADPTVHIEMATLLQDTDLERATGAYTEALRLTLEKEAQQQGENVAADPAITELAVNLLTNLGGVTALRGMEKSVSAGGDAGSEERLALLDAGRARLGEALTRAADAGLDAPMATATYNLGRVYEAIGRADSAREAYERLLGGHPEYTDAKVRLALLAVSNGRREKDVANTLFKEALASNPGALDTRAAYAHFLAGQTTGAPNPQWSAVKDLAAQLLGPNPPGFPSATAARLAADEARRDPHTLSTLGWAYYQLALLPSTTSSNPRAERARQMFRAADLLDKALAADPRCAFAAQGLTVLLSEDALVTSSAEAHQSGAEERRKKNWDEAIALLGKLREVREDGSVHVCAGHVLMMKEEFERALKSYELASRRFYNNEDTPTLLHLSRAEYALGMRERSYARMSRSIAYLRDARAVLAIRPGGPGSSDDRFARYNTAVIWQKALQMLFELPNEKRSLKDMQEAIEGLEEAQKIFAELTPEAQAGKLLYITADLIEQRFKYGESSLQRQAERQLAEQAAYEEARAVAREAAASVRREKEEARARELAEREEAHRKYAADLAEQRRKQLEEAREWAVHEPSPPPEEKVRRKGGGGGSKKSRSRKTDVDDEDEEMFGGVDSDEGDADRERTPPSTATASAKKERKRKKSAAKKRQTVRSEEESNNESETEQPRRRKKAKKESALSKATISTSDEEDTE